MEQVFRLPELLEVIFMNLPQKELLLCQRVSRSFQHTVEGSIHLQRALFLAPDWSLEGRVLDACSAMKRLTRPKPENNRLLLRVYPGCYPTVTLVIVDYAPTPNELIIGRRGGEQWSWDICISFPADKPPNSCPAVEYPEASWRRMFLSQPPCTKLHLVRRWQRSLKPAMIRNGGITMGDFVGEAQTAGSWHESYISSDRDWHFEANIQCSSLEDISSEAAEAASIFAGYVFSRSGRNGAARAYSDDWDPGRTAGFARAML
ncbi:hypothetical protein LTR36_003979 [Oleoguttula mirabilis]|uniref:F-box domain-containing protein n=1 Tax=Oleoguttula mirabilis TaxID=1507867 RepID=A0AAV9JIE8_9PEZI|nr:hypothetical protein LTR36_003979 [Oleoguttula mirabilis]